MSLRALVAVTECPAIQGAARRAASQIANTMNDKHQGFGWAGISLMAARSGCSTRTLMNGIKELELQGLLTVMRRPGKSSYYRLDLDKIESLGVKSLSSGPASAPRPDLQAANSSGPNGSAVTRLNKPNEDASDKRRGRPSARAKDADVEVKDGNIYYRSRLRKDWDRDLKYYRDRLDQGVLHPAWPFSAGPRPTEPYCMAPPDLLRHYGFPSSQSTCTPAINQLDRHRVPRQDKVEISQP